MSQKETLKLHYNAFYECQAFIYGGTMADI